MPAPQWPAPATTGPAASFDPDVEARTYPAMWRLAGRTLQKVPALLHPGEGVLATAPGEGDVVAGGTAMIGVNLTKGFLLIATDRRVLVLGLKPLADGRDEVMTFPYADITQWLPRYSRGSTLMTKTGRVDVVSPAQGVTVKRLPRERFEAVRAVVEPRLAPTARRS